MGKLTYLLILFSAMVLPFCSISKKNAGTVGKEATLQQVSYKKDIFPIMQMRCTPCHFPEKGFKKMLNTYEAVRDNVGEILIRIQLTKSDDKFMPFRNKKEPLSDSLINIFKDWKEQKMPM